MHIPQKKGQRKEVSVKKKRLICLRNVREIDLRDKLL